MNKIVIESLTQKILTRCGFSLILNMFSSSKTGHITWGSTHWLLGKVQYPYAYFNKKNWVQWYLEICQRLIDERIIKIKGY